MTTYATYEERLAGSLLVDVRFAEAEKIVLVMDDLNTQTPATLYRTFAPAEAKRLSDRLEVHYTPKRGSWLNMAEIEMPVLARQCLSERVGSKAKLQEQIAAWQDRRNASSIRVGWRYTTEDARIKLKRLYPTL